MKKSSTIKINNNIYNISLNFGVIMGIQQDIKGIKVDDIFTGIQNQRFDIINSLLYHGIKFNHKEFTRKDIEMLDLSDIEEVFTAMGDLFEKSLPQSKEEDEDTEKK